MEGLRRCSDLEIISSNSSKLIFGKMVSFQSGSPSSEIVFSSSTAGVSDNLPQSKKKSKTSLALERSSSSLYPSKYSMGLQDHPWVQSSEKHWQESSSPVLGSWITMQYSWLKDPLGGSSGELWFS
eukprot:TRINITY_DN13222_c0_g2_i1.p1 TRINITY_DN13222_c0_g2~~TRINITY_DN13222_c0_g2_i1.p1  ORF type:complete len:126 (-),score=19.54 TRINITY_DN13222_c0_g2_i1:42-419(-)